MTEMTRKELEAEVIRAERYRAARVRAWEANRENLVLFWRSAHATSEHLNACHNLTAITGTEQ